MRRMLRYVLMVTVLVGSGFAAVPSRAQSAPPTPGPCQQGVLPSGALSMICIPSSGWNGDLVIWAHGYTWFNQPLGFQNLTFPGGIYLPTLVQSLGFAFATTSYRKNGLAILEGVQDIRELVAASDAVMGHPAVHTYMTGASEGGIVTTLAVERYPKLFSGGLAACGPIGNFEGQLNYWGGFRVLFNYFFPGVVPGSVGGVPMKVINNWNTVYQPAMANAVQSNPDLGAQLIATSKAPTDTANPVTSIYSTTNDLMAYAALATDDGLRELQGDPFNNVSVYYSGSENDARLNRLVQRVSPNPEALESVRSYQTSGNLTLPLVTLHTTGDDVIPYWHELLYQKKAHPTGEGQLTQIKVTAYGHCNFTITEILAAFFTLIQQVTGTHPSPNIVGMGINSAALQRTFAQYQRIAPLRASAPSNRAASTSARAPSQ